MRTSYGPLLFALVILGPGAAAAVPETDAVVPEVEELQAEANGSNGNVVDAIIKLKAFCQEAAKTDFYQAGLFPHEGSAIVEIIRLFHRHPDDHSQAYHFNDFPGAMPYGDEPDTGKGNSIVTQYGLVMKRLLPLHGGIFRYLLQHIDHAVIAGRDPFLLRGKYVTFNAQVLGLQSSPEYLKEFEIKDADLQKAILAIPHKVAIGNDAVVAALHEGQSSFYQQSLDKILAADKAKQDAYDAECEKAALAAMRKEETVTAVAKVQAVDPVQAPNPIYESAMEACQKSRGVRPPVLSLKEAEKMAREEASKMVRDHAHKSNTESIAKNGHAVASQPAVSQVPEEPVVYDDEDYLTGGYDDAYIAHLMKGYD